MPGPQRADVSVAVLTVQVVGSTDVVVSPRRVLVLTGPFPRPELHRVANAHVMCVFAFQLGTVRCPDTTIAIGDSSPAWWFWFVATVAIICWTALLFRRTPTLPDVENSAEETQTGFLCSSCYQTRPRCHYAQRQLLPYRGLPLHAFCSSRKRGLPPRRCSGPSTLQNLHARPANYWLRRTGKDSSQS